MNFLIFLVAFPLYVYSDFWEDYSKNSLRNIDLLRNHERITDFIDSSFRYVDCYGAIFNLTSFVIGFVDIYKQKHSVKQLDKLHFNLRTELFTIRFESVERDNDVIIVNAKTIECSEKLKSVTIERVLKNSMVLYNMQLLTDFSPDFKFMTCNRVMKLDEFIEKRLYDSENRLSGQVTTEEMRLEELSFVFKGEKSTIVFRARRKLQNPHEFMLIRGFESCGEELRGEQFYKELATSFLNKLLAAKDDEELNNMIDPYFILYDCGHFQHDRDEYVEKSMLKSTLSNGIVETAKYKNGKIIFIVKAGDAHYSNIACLTGGDNLELLSSTRIYCKHDPK